MLSSEIILGAQNSPTKKRQTLRILEFQELGNNYSSTTPTFSFLFFQQWLQQDCFPGDSLFSPFFPIFGTVAIEKWLPCQLPLKNREISRIFSLSFIQCNKCQNNNRKEREGEWIVSNPASNHSVKKVLVIPEGKGEKGRENKGDSCLQSSPIQLYEFAIPAQGKETTRKMGWSHFHVPTKTNVDNA